MTTEKVFVFGSYRFLATQRLLMACDQQVRIGSRAGEILAVLLEHAGEVVSKSVLIKHVWSNVHVGEVTLRVHIAALRSTLKKDRSVRRHIETVTGIGYRFVAPIEITAASQSRGDINLDHHPLPQIVEYLEKKNLLIVLENGDRLIAVAALAAAVRDTFE